MTVPYHVRLELRFIRKLYPADAANQSFPCSQRLYVFLEVYVFVRRNFSFNQRQASSSFFPTFLERVNKILWLLYLLPRVTFVRNLDIQLVVRREVLDLVEHLGLDFHLAPGWEKSDEFSYLTRDFARCNRAPRSPRFRGHCICRILDNFASASARNGGAPAKGGVLRDERFNDSTLYYVKRETKEKKNEGKKRRNRVGEKGARGKTRRKWKNIASSTCLEMVAFYIMNYAISR